MVQLPEGVELTLSELQDMAARQQQQIESQQQMLVAKEQRLKFLKQQEMHPQQSATENSERLRRLRERVEAQELKLRKLRALRGQVDQQKMNNSSLNSELESIRALFNEKEKELSLAVAKVEELTQQLEELKRGRLNNQVIGGNSSNIIELEKLRRELMYRNKLNEQQNNKLAQQREALSKGQEEMNRIDRRIAELQQRLHRKRFLNQQLANQINAATTAKQAQLRSSQVRNRLRPLSTNIAAVEPFKHTPQETQAAPQSSQPTSQDDLHPKLSTAKSEDLPEFQPNKNDPKYQTLPVNTKFSVKFNKSDVPNLNDDCKVNETSTKKSDEMQHIIPSVSNNNNNNNSALNGKTPPTHTVHSIPAYTPPKSHAMPIAQQTSQLQVSHLSISHSKQNLTNLAPKPYGSTYNSSILSSPGQLTNRNVLMGSASSVSPGNSAPKYVPPPAPPIPSTSIQPSSPLSSFRSSTNLPVTPLTTSVLEKSSPAVPTSLQQSKTPPSVGSQPRPSPIYQTSSTRIAPATPHSLSTTPQGILREVEDLSGCGISPSNGDINSKPGQFNARKSNVTLTSHSRGPASANIPMTGESSVQPASDHQVESSRNINSEQPMVSKPSLPPKPNVPLKPQPPPRQIHAPGGEKMKVDTSPDSVDSALNILRGTQTSKANLNYRYANRNAITDSYAQKLGGSSLNRYLRNVSQPGNNEGEPDRQTENLASSYANEGDGDMDSASKKLTNDLPIKAKPLTIKKHSGVDPPKLKLPNGNSLSTSHRKPSPPLDNSSTNNVNNNNNNKNVNGNIIVGDQSVIVTAEHIHNGNSSANTNSRSTPSVHVSINRRIEMPPAFLFPENEAPPPDLHGIGRELMSGNNGSGLEATQTDVTDNAEMISLPPPLVPPPYPGTQVDKAWDLKVQSESGRYSESSKEGNGSTSDSAHLLSLEDQTQRLSIDLREDKADGDAAVDDTLKVNIQIYNNEDESLSGSSSDSQPTNAAGMVRRAQKGNLKTKGSSRNVRRVSFDPLALLLDASLEGELELVKKTAKEVPNPSAANDEGITALHNAICAGHYEIVKFLVEFGCDVNAQDSDGWTPLHCAASCNNLPMVKFLVEHGACIFATTLSDHETAAEKCEEDEEGFDGCSEYLYSIQEKLGILNNGAVYALYDYEAQNTDEIGFKDREMIIVLRKGDEFEREWWWSRIKNKEGYIPRNLLGLYPRVNPSKNQ